jgi:exopolysaccharide production protein ExoQ
MPPHLALLFGIGLVVYALWSDRKRDYPAIKDILWPTLWYMVVSSRLVGVWLSTWGIPLPTGGGDPTEGSQIDRYFFALLTMTGLWVLARRGFSWRTCFSKNPWPTAFLVFMALSIVWSGYPFVSFKRFIKILGAVVMALVVLSNERPLDALLTVLRRCLYVHLPMSIICIRYFRHIGVSFDWFGSSVLWQGISTSKNTLGQVAMLGVLYFSWEVARNWSKVTWRNLHVLYVLMALYLLKGSDAGMSMTSVSVCVLAIATFYSLQSLRGSPEGIRRFTRLAAAGLTTLILLVVAHSIVLFSEDSLFGYVITKFGRDITLTDRTYIWTDVYAAASNDRLLGVGVGGFWIGREANIPWNSTKTWVLGQAHSGYVDTYLQLGLVGVLLLTMLLLSRIPRLLSTLDDNFDFACFRITLLLTIAFVNITESTYLRGDHHLWLLFQTVIWFLPSCKSSADAVLNRRRASARLRPRTSGSLRPTGVRQLRDDRHERRHHREVPCWRVDQKVLTGA